MHILSIYSNILILTKLRILQQSHPLEKTQSKQTAFLFVLLTLTVTNEWKSLIKPKRRLLKKKWRTFTPPNSDTLPEVILFSEVQRAIFARRIAVPRTP